MRLVPHPAGRQGGRGPQGANTPPESRGSGGSLWLDEGRGRLCRGRVLATGGAWLPGTLAADRTVVSLGCAQAPAGQTPKHLWGPRPQADAPRLAVRPAAL